MWVDPGSVTWTGCAVDDGFVGVSGRLCELMVHGLVGGVGEASLRVALGVLGKGCPSWWVEVVWKVWP